MPRAQVRVLIQDDSFVMPGTESGGTSVCGIVSSRTNNLVKALGNTAERSMGYMTIDSSREWMDRLNSNEPTGYGSGWKGYDGVSGAGLTDTVGSTGHVQAWGSLGHAMTQLNSSGRNLRLQQVILYTLNHFSISLMVQQVDTTMKVVHITD